MKKALGLVIVAFGLAVAAAWWQGAFNHSQIPLPQSHENFPTNPSPTPIPVSQLPAEINLDVPFTTQAPKVVWDADHEEFCEEASVLMAAAYSLNFKISSADFADSKLYEIKDYEMQTLGYFKDTTTAETLKIMQDHFNMQKTQIVSNPNLDTIKQTLASGKIIVAPFAGRLLENPNFTGGGPPYHMLIIKGYTKDGKIITNDPGTRKGANYIYSSDVILNALHDWNGGDVDHGAKVMIVVG